MGSTVSAAIMQKYAIQDRALFYCFLNYPNNLKIFINYKRTYISYMQIMYQNIINLMNLLSSTRSFAFIILSLFQKIQFYISLSNSVFFSFVFELIKMVSQSRSLMGIAFHSNYVPKIHPCMQLQFIDLHCCILLH